MLVHPVKFLKNIKNFMTSADATINEADLNEMCTNMLNVLMSYFVSHFCYRYLKHNEQRIFFKSLKTSNFSKNKI